MTRGTQAYRIRDMAASSRLGLTWLRKVRTWSIDVEETEILALVRSRLLTPIPGTADGEWRAELKQGTTYLARNLAVAAAAVSRAAKELHEDLSSPIDEVIEEARSQQAARVAILEAELEAARKALADLD